MNMLWRTSNHVGQGAARRSCIADADVDLTYDRQTKELDLRQRGETRQDRSVGDVDVIDLIVVEVSSPECSAIRIQVERKQRTCTESGVGVEDGSGGGESIHI